MLNGSAVVAEWGGTAHRRAILGRDRVDRLAADAVVLPARQPLVRARRHALLIGADELELERRRTGVEHQNVHPAASLAVSRAAAARARISAASGVSPYAEMCPIFLPGRATRFPYR